jgi:SAM-dependent methyltransferase
MSEFKYIAKQLLNNRSVYRAYLNLALTKQMAKGKTIDVGAGGGGGKYLDTLPKETGVTVEHFDQKTGQFVDFEKDRLPADNNTYDTTIFLNVMEHIFNYQHIADEVVRITKPGGQIIGYVPFLMWYHPDPSDYFRYTHQSIEKIFKAAGAKEVTIEKHVRGPFTICAAMTVLMVPRFLRPVFFAPLYALDRLFLKFQNNPDQRHVMGYLFVVSK